jgi:hypothetical protein
VREVLFKDKFLTQSAPDIHKKLSLWLKRKKSLNQVIQLCIAMSVCLYVCDLTGKKKIRDIMTSLLLSEKAPPNWGLHPKLATMVERRGTLQRMLKEDCQESAPPQPGPCHLCKGNHWRSKCSHLQMEGEETPMD